MGIKELGDFGENLACEYLVNNGYKIIGKNYRINFGEIDIIAKKKWGLFIKDYNVIHFIEVKTSENTGDNFFPEQRVDWKKQQKYRRLSEVWLKENKYPQDIPCQVDIIAVSFGKINISLKSTTVDFNELGEPEIKFFENVVKG